VSRVHGRRPTSGILIKVIGIVDEKRKDFEKRNEGQKGRKRKKAARMERNPGESTRGRVKKGRSRTRDTWGGVKGRARGWAKKTPNSRGKPKCPLRVPCKRETCRKLGKGK